MGALRRYEVDIDGRKTVLQLSDEDAAGYGTAATPIGGSRPARHTRPESEADADDEAAVPKGRKVANKARETDHHRTG